MPDYWVWNDGVNKSIGSDFTSLDYIYNAVVQCYEAYREREAALSGNGIPIQNLVVGDYAIPRIIELQQAATNLAAFFIDATSANITWVANIAGLNSGPFALPTPKTVIQTFPDPTKFPRGNGWQRKCPREIYSRTAQYCAGATVQVNSYTYNNNNKYFVTPPQIGDVARLIVIKYPQQAYPATPTSSAVAAISPTPPEDYSFAGQYYQYTSTGWILYTNRDACNLATISDFGPAVAGDYIGTWNIEDLNYAFNLLKWSYITNGPFASNQYNQQDSASFYRTGIYIKTLYEWEVYGVPASECSKHYGSNGQSKNGAFPAWHASTMSTICLNTIPVHGTRSYTKNVQTYPGPQYPKGLVTDSESYGTSFGQLAIHFKDPSATFSSELKRNVDWYAIGIPYTEGYFQSPPPDYWRCPYGYQYNAPTGIGSSEAINCYDLDGPMAGGSTPPPRPPDGGMYSWSAVFSAVIKWHFKYASDSSGPPLTQDNGCVDNHLCTYVPPNCPPFNISGCCPYFKVTTQSGNTSSTYYANQSNGGWSGPGINISQTILNECTYQWRMNISSGNTASGYLSNADLLRCPDPSSWSFDSGLSNQSMGITCVSCSNELLTGTPIFSYAANTSNPGPPTNVFDGDLSTYMNSANPNDNWVGLDLGQERFFGRARFASRAGQAALMVGGHFDVSYSSNFSTGVTTLYTITTAPPDNQYVDIPFNSVGRGQYIRYYSPPGSYGNVAELEFYGCET